MQIKQLAHRRLLFISIGWIILLVCASQAFALAADTPPAAENEPVVGTKEVAVDFWNRQITILRATIAGADPEMRAERIIARLDELPLRTRASDIETASLQRRRSGWDSVCLQREGFVFF